MCSVWDGMGWEDGGWVGFSYARRGFDDGVGVISQVVAYDDISMQSAKDTGYVQGGSSGWDVSLSGCIDLYP